jgi:hypothetical protein
MNPSFSRVWEHESNAYAKRLARARRRCFRTDILCDIGRRSRPESQLLYAHCFVFAAYFQRQCVMSSGDWTKSPREVRDCRGKVCSRSVFGFTLSSSWSLRQSGTRTLKFLFAGQTSGHFLDPINCKRWNIRQNRSKSRHKLMPAFALGVVGIPDSE